MCFPKRPLTTTRLLSQNTRPESDEICISYGKVSDIAQEVPETAETM